MKNIKSKIICLILASVALVIVGTVSINIGGSYVLANSTSTNKLAAYGLGAAGILMGIVLKGVVMLLGKRNRSVPELALILPLALGGIGLTTYEMTDKFFYLKAAAPAMVANFGDAASEAPQSTELPQKTSVALLYCGVLMLETGFTYFAFNVIEYCARSPREDELHTLIEDEQFILRNIKKLRRHVTKLRGELAACDRARAIYDSPDHCFHAIKNHLIR